MPLHIYEPHLRAVQLDNGRIRRVPTEIIGNAKKGQELETIKLWAVQAGHIGENDEVGQFAPVYS